MTAREIADIFERIQLRLIASLKRNLARHKAEEKEYGFSWPAWQAEKLQNIERFRQENQAILAEYHPIIDQETENLIQEEYDAGTESAKTEPPDTKHFFGVNERRVGSLIEDVNNNLHTAESASLRMMDDVYRQTIYRAEMAAATGSVTMEQAVDMAVKDFLAAGINCIQYRDGRMVNIATYAEMAIRSASLRSYLRGEADRREALGIDTVLVSQYGACSDTCLPWQGKVYIDDVWGHFDGERRGNMGKSRNGKWYLLLSVAVDSGLFHPNCRHTLSIWIDGISRKPEPADAEKVRETAKLEQKQRRMENRIRRLKRLAEGTLEPEKAKEYRRKIRAAQKALREFIDEHSDQLRRDYWREKTHGIPEAPNKSDGKNLNYPSDGDIINSGDKNMKSELLIDKFTPCLEDAATGETVGTSYSIASKSELSRLKGWNFNWTSADLKDAEIYKLTLKGSEEIQGLVALTKFEHDKAVYVNIAESAPHNLGSKKRYNGVGGHLFAIAAKKSVDFGYDGFVFMDAKNIELVHHYEKALGATLLGIPHEYRMFIDEEAAARLLDIYTFEEG